MDLAQAVEFDESAAFANIQAVRPGMQVFKVSSKSGAGMNELFDYLRSRLAASRETAIA